ncbi:unnamed protein product, partial [Gulo gulo]
SNIFSFQDIHKIGGKKINFEVLTKVTPICFVHWAQGEWPNLCSHFKL